MTCIKLDEDRDLVITKKEPIYRGDRINQKLVFLVPMSLGEIDMESATVYLSYIRADGTADIALLTREEEPYNEDYFLYRLPITSDLSRYAGQVCVFMTIMAGCARCPVVAKSGECLLYIQDSRNMDEYISDRNLRLIYEMQKHMDDRIDKAEERIMNTEKTLADKADNIVFDPETSTIQLVATSTVTDEETGEEESVVTKLGEAVFVRADQAVELKNAYLNEEGHLILVLGTGVDGEETEKDLGLAVGKDGAVYVPHVDEHKILTFTLEDAPAEPPGPVDLDPLDEWGDIGDGGMDAPVKSSYVWEDM